MKTVLVVAIVFGLCFTAFSVPALQSEAEASAPVITLYPADRSGWESAVGAYEEECFTDATLNPGISVVSEYPGYVDTTKGVWWDRLVCPAYGMTTTTWHFSTPISGFGGSWDPGVPGGPGANIALAINGAWVNIGEIPNTYTGQFWGFVSSEPFHAVRLSPGSYCGIAWCETYELDNMVYSYSGLSPVSWVKVTSQTGAYICNDSVDFRFERDLTVGSRGDDVKYLQILLNSNPLTRIAIEGAGSPGNETVNFGPLTQAAVREFQEERGLPDTGIVAGDTRTALNALVQQYAPVKTIPTGWALRVIDTHENSQVDYGCVWWEVEDATDGIRGWTPYKNNIDNTTYMEEILANVGEQGTREISNVDERKATIVSAVKNRANLFQELSSFPSELLLAIIAGEMTSGADNTHISCDCGRGISQVTNPNDLVGRYGGVRCYGGTTKGYMPYEYVGPVSITSSYWIDRSCVRVYSGYFGEFTYRACECKGQEECEEGQPWYYGGTDTTGRCKYYPSHDDGCRAYTNTVQGIEANLKDGKGRLKEGYGTSISRNTGTESSFAFTTELKQEALGKEVAYLQYILKSEMDQNLPVTADFGSMTEKALKDFQAREFPGEDPSGIVDQDTRNKLNMLLDDRYSALRGRVEEIKSWLGATWRYQGSYGYLSHVAERVEDLNEYFPNHKTQLGGDILNEADWQFMLAAMENYLSFGIESPVEFRIHDSQGHVTGIIKGQVHEDIPDSEFDHENEVALVLLPSGSYVYEVVGTDAGLYGLEGALVQGGEILTFRAIDIPVNADTVHLYLIDWDALARGENGVTVQVDSDGDGVFEQSFTTGSVLTGDEFILKTETIVTVDPETLNLQARGRWITAYIELPHDCAVEDIDVGTVQLLYGGNVIEADWGDVQNGVLMVKFDCATVARWFDGLHDEEVELTVAGEVNGIEFEGTADVRVIDPPRLKRGRLQLDHVFVL